MHSATAKIVERSNILIRRVIRLFTATPSTSVTVTIARIVTVKQCDNSNAEQPYSSADAVKLPVDLQTHFIRRERLGADGVLFQPPTAATKEEAVKHCSRTISVGCDQIVKTEEGGWVENPPAKIQHLSEYDVL